MRVILAGGWTGGHLFTALAIAEALRERDARAEVCLVGARGGMELGHARAAGLAVAAVWLDGIARGKTVRAFAGNLALPLKLAVAGGQARGILARFRPDVVVGVGAYVSFPIVAMAALRGVATLLHEANAVPGVANAWLARHADVVCVGFDQAKRHFLGGDAVGAGWSRTRRGPRVVHTGNPVRPALSRPSALSPHEARARLGLEPSKVTVLVTGGSLGSARLNDWMLAEGRHLAAAGALQLIWQCGKAHHAACRARLGDATAVHLVAFLEDMPAAYAAAELVVSSAGAGTLAELASARKPAVVIPDRGVSEDHQMRNAEALRASGVPVWDRPDGAPELAALVRTLANAPEDLRALGATMARMAHPRAAAAVAAEIVALRGRSVSRGSAGNRLPEDRR